MFNGSNITIVTFNRNKRIHINVDNDLYTIEKVNCFVNKMMIE